MQSSNQGELPTPKTHEQLLENLLAEARRETNDIGVILAATQNRVEDLTRQLTEAMRDADQIRAHHKEEVQRLLDDHLATIRRQLKEATDNGLLWSGQLTECRRQSSAQQGRVGELEGALREAKDGLESWTPRLLGRIQQDRMRLLRAFVLPPRLRLR